MEDRRPSTLKLLRTLRESSHPIKSIKALPGTGNFVSYDAAAVRLWDIQRQIKASHADVKDENLKFIRMTVLPSIQCVLQVFSSRKKDTEGGVIRIFSSSLKLLQEIDLQMLPLEKVLFSPDNLDIILLDSSKSAQIIHIEILEKNVEKLNESAPVFYSKTEPLAKQLKPKKNLQVVKLHKVQVIDCAQIDIKDIIVIDLNTIFVLSVGIIMILTRNGLYKTHRTFKAINKVERDEDGNEIPKSAEKTEETPYNEFKHTSTLILKFDVLSRAPVFIRQFKDNLLNVVYNDGVIQVIQYSSQLISPVQAIPESAKPVVGQTFLLGEFLAFHFPPTDNKGGEMKIDNLINNILDASDCETFGANCYLEEIFTVGYDLRIIHWGIRYISNQDDTTVAMRIESTEEEEEPVEQDLDQLLYTEEVSLLTGDLPVTMDYLGEYELPDPSLKGIIQKPNSNPISLLPYLQLLVTPLMTEKGRPLTKIISGNFGGLIFQLELIHPHVNVYKWKSLVKLPNDKTLNKNEASTNDLTQAIKFATRGPELKHPELMAETLADYQFVKDGSEDHQEKKDNQESTFLAMKDGVLDIISVNSGKILQSVNLDHIKEANVEPHVKLVGNIGKDMTLTRMEETVEIRASIVHWCPYSQYILVGYCSGIVGVLRCEDSIQSVHNHNLDFSYMRTNEIHDGEITLLKTFRFRYCSKLYNDPLEGDVSKDIIVCLLGDAHGNMSLWQLSPQTKAKSALLFHIRQHSGKLLHANICEIPANILSVNSTSSKKADYNNQFLLITSCDKGMTYAWRMERNLKLQIIAYFQSNHLPHRQTSFVAIPKMIYRKSILKNGNALAQDSSLVANSLQMDSTDKGKIYAALFASKSISSTSQGNFPNFDLNDKEIAVLCYEIYCIVGFSDGFFEIWALSSDSKYCSVTPIISVQEMKMMISSISLYNSQFSTKTNQQEIQEENEEQREEEETDEEDEGDQDEFQQQKKKKKKQKEKAVDPVTTLTQSSNDEIRTIPNTIVKEFSLANHPYEEIEKYDTVNYAHVRFKPAFDQDIFLSGYQDGSVLLYRVTINIDYDFDEDVPFDDNQSVGSSSMNASGKKKRMKLEKLSVLKLPSTLLTLLPYPFIDPTWSAGIPYNDWPFLFVSEFNVYEFLPFVCENNVLPKKWGQTYENFEEFFMKNLKRSKTFSNNRIPPFKANSTASSSKLSSTGSWKALTSGTNKTQLSVRDKNSQPSSADFERYDEQQEGVDEDKRSETPYTQQLAEPITNLSPPKPQRPPSRATSAGAEKQYVGKMESMQRIMSAELHQAKKDKRLIELFTHKLESNDGTVNSEQAIDIVYQWVIEYQASKLEKMMKGTTPTVPSTAASNKSASAGGHGLKRADSDLTNLTKSTSAATQVTNTVLEIKKENLKELFNLLDINMDTDRLKFIEVAKVAAITMSAVEKSLQISQQQQQAQSKPPYILDGDNMSLDDSNIHSGVQSSNNSVSDANNPGVLGKSYTKLRTKAVKVSYNSMGEKVYEKVSFTKPTMGMPKGLLSTVKKMFYEHLQPTYQTNPPPATAGIANTPQRPGPIFTDTLGATTTVGERPISPSRVQKKRRLKLIPVQFTKLIAPKKFPNLKEEYYENPNKRNIFWTPTGLHYFDLVRTIRIARSILDMRSIEQYEILHNPNKNTNFLLLSNSWGVNPDENGVASIPKLLLKYFERQFGECSNLMNVTRYKVINYLEACLQYSQYAIIHLFKNLLYLDDEKDSRSPSHGRQNAEFAKKGRELGLWIITEARNLLLSRGCIVVGGVIQTIDGMSVISANNSASVQLNQMDNISVSSTLLSPNTFTNLANPVAAPGSSDMRWQYVSKTDALHVCDEILRTRGCFGPHMYVTILHLIDMLPAATLSQIMIEESNIMMATTNNNSNEPVNMKVNAAEKIVRNPDELMIDLEKFLEILYFEFLHQDYTCRLQNNLVFGEYAFVGAITAKAREINANESSKRELIINDDTGLGPYHTNNLSRIRDMLHLLIKYDPLRTGEIDPILGQKLLIKILLDLTFYRPARGSVTSAESIENHKYQDIVHCERIVNIAKNKTKLTSIEDKLSYIDIIAVFLAWEEQNQGVKPFIIDELINTIEYIERSIDTHLARDLIKYFTCVSSLDHYENPLWVIGVDVEKSLKEVTSPGKQQLLLENEEQKDLAMIDRVVTPHLKKKLQQSLKESFPIPGVDNQKKLTLPMDGVWRLPNALPPNELPGLLQVKPALIQETNRVNERFASFTSIKESHRKELEAHLSLVPVINPTKRAKTTLFGETVKPIDGVVPITQHPAPLKVQTLNQTVDFTDATTDNKDIFTDNLNKNVNENYFALYTKDGEDPLRTSYSRVLENMQPSSYVTPGFTPSSSQQHLMHSRIPSPQPQRLSPAVQAYHSAQGIRSEPSQYQTMTQDSSRKHSMDLSKGGADLDDDEINQYFDENNNFNLDYFLNPNGDENYQPFRSDGDEELRDYVIDQEGKLKNQPSVNIPHPTRKEQEEDDGSQVEGNEHYPIFKENSTNSIDSNYQHFDINYYEDGTNNKQSQSLQQASNPPREASLSIDTSEASTEQPPQKVIPSPKSPANEPIDLHFQSPPYPPRATPFHERKSRQGANNLDPSTASLSSGPELMESIKLNPNSALTPFLQFSDPQQYSSIPLNHNNNDSLLQASQSTLSHSNIISNQNNHNNVYAFLTGSLTGASTSQSPSQEQQQQELMALIDPPSQDDIINHELSSRISNIIHLEKEFQIAYLQEEKNYLQKRLEKEKMRNALRREMYVKNKVGMDYYYKALEERYRRLHKGQLLLQKNLDKEKKDKMAKELEIQRILEKNRQSLIGRQENKLSKDELLKLGKQQEKELKLMYKEDKASMIMRDADNQARLRAEAEKNKLNEEEMTRQLEKYKEDQLRKQREMEEERRRARRRAQEEDEEDEEEPEEDEGLNLQIPSMESASQDQPAPVSTGKKYRSRSIFGSLGASTDNYDPNSITPPPQSPKPEEKEEDEFSADDTATNESSSRPMTAIEEHLKKLLNNIQSSLSEHATHPRKLMKNGKYYIPLLFQEDLEFNPFNSNITQLNDFILDNLEKEKERQALELLQENGGEIVRRVTSRDFFSDLGGTDVDGEQEKEEGEGGGEEGDALENGSVHGGVIPGGDEDDELSYASFNTDDPTIQELSTVKFASNPFDDLSNTLKEYRKMNEKKRKLLFATNNHDVPIPQWTPVFKASHVNWKQFFKKEKTKLEIIKQMGEAILNDNSDEDEEDDGAFHGDDHHHHHHQHQGGDENNNKEPETYLSKKQKQQMLEKSLLAGLKSRSSHGQSHDEGDENSLNSLSSLGSFSQANGENEVDANPLMRPLSTNRTGLTNTRASFFTNAPENMSASIQQIPKTLLESLPKDVKKDIIPLPFGKIEKKHKVYQGKFKFYQLEVFNSNSLLTIEIEMLKGNCDLLVHYEKLPSSVKFHHKLSCTAKRRKKKNSSPLKDLEALSSSKPGTANTATDGVLTAPPTEPNSPMLPRKSPGKANNHNNKQMSINPASPSVPSPGPLTLSPEAKSMSRLPSFASPNGGNLPGAAGAGTAGNMSRNPSFLSPPGGMLSKSQSGRPGSNQSSSHPPGTANSSTPQPQQPQHLEGINEGQSTDEEGLLPQPHPRNDRIYRLTIEPQGAGSYYIAVNATSSPGCIYNLWAYLSGDISDSIARIQPIPSQSIHSSNPSISSISTSQQHLAKVDQIIRKWNHLLDDNDEENLLINFPKLEMDAENKVLQENTRKLSNLKKKHEIIDEVKTLKENDLLEKTLEEVDVKTLTAKENMKNPDSLLEVENLENFVTKIGRYAIRKERETILKKTKEILEQQMNGTGPSTGMNTNPSTASSTSTSNHHQPIVSQSSSSLLQRQQSNLAGKLRKQKTSSFLINENNILQDQLDKHEGDGGEGYSYNERDGIDFENLFDANDAFLQQSDYLIHEAAKDNNNNHLLTQQRTKRNLLSRTPSTANPTTLSSLNKQGTSKKIHKMGTLGPKMTGLGALVHQLTTANVGHAQLPEKTELPQSFQHPELFSAPNIARQEKLMLLKPFNAKEEINFLKEIEQFKQEENFLQQQKQFVRQSSSLPVLSLHFNTVRFNNQVVHTSPKSSQRNNRSRGSPNNNKPKKRYSEIMAMASYSHDNEEANCPSPTDQQVLSSSSPPSQDPLTRSTSIPKLPQIALPKSVVQTYDNLENIVQANSPFSRGGGSSTGRRSAGHSRGGFEDDLDYQLRSERESPAQHSLTFSASANSIQFSQRKPFEMGGAFDNNDNYDDEDEAEGTPSPMTRRPFFASHSQFTSVPSSLMKDSSADSPVVNVLLDKRLKAVEKKGKKKAQEKTALQKKLLLVNPKIINYSLSKTTEK